MSISPLPTIYRNIRAFLEYRGAKHSVADLSDQEIAKFFIGNGPQKFHGEITRENIASSASSGQSSEIVVAVFLASSKHVKGSKDFRSAVDALKASPTREVLVVFELEIPDKTRLKYSAMVSGDPDKPIRVVSQKIFLVNIPQMACVPPHRPLSAEEVTELEKHFYLDRSSISSYILWQTDPACIWCGAKRGDVVEIRRRNDTSGECVDYRLCV